MHRAVLVATRTTNDIGEPWIRIYERRFNLEGGHLIHTVAVDDVSHLKARKANLPDALYLVVDFIALQILFGADMRKHTIALALSDIEGLPVSGVNQPVNIEFELARYLMGERFDL